jgi:uncharacterized protein YcfL
MKWIIVILLSLFVIGCDSIATELVIEDRQKGCMDCQPWILPSPDTLKQIN